MTYTGPTLEDGLEMTASLFVMFSLLHIHPKNKECKWSWRSFALSHYSHEVCMWRLISTCCPMNTGLEYNFCGVYMSSLWACGFFVEYLIFSHHISSRSPTACIRSVEDPKLPLGVSVVTHSRNDKIIQYESTVEESSKNKKIKYIKCWMKRCT